jgi:DNA polymerase I
MAPDQSIDDPEPVVKGAASKRSDTALLTRELETAIFDAVFSGQERDIPELIYEAGREIDPDDPDWNRIGIPGAINKPLADYASFGPAIAAENSNAVLGTAFGEGDKPKRIYIRESYFEGTDEKITSIAFDEPSDLAPILDAMQLDVQGMTTKLIEKPLGDLLAALDVDVKAALTGQSQSSLEAWI